MAPRANKFGHCFHQPRCAHHNSHRLDGSWHVNDYSKVASRAAQHIHYWPMQGSWQLCRAALGNTLVLPTDSTHTNRMRPWNHLPPGSIAGSRDSPPSFASVNMRSRWCFRTAHCIQKSVLLLACLVPRDHGSSSRPWFVFISSYILDLDNKSGDLCSAQF